jgi:hypothetical protein
MTPIRKSRIVVAAAAATLVVAAAAPAADAPTVGAALTISASPNKIGRVVNGVGTPIALKVRMVFTHPADSRLQLQRVKVLLPGGVGKPNGKLFPSCSSAALNRARGALRVCPRGSKVGSGIAKGTAVDLGVSSSGKLTFFNGPGGKSLTLNVSILNPAQINATFTAPIKKISGRYGYSVTFNIPTQLQTILDGPIRVTSIDSTVGVTRIVRGVRRGYIEATRCPPSRRAPAHAEFSFSDGSTSTADTNITCR